MRTIRVRFTKEEEGAYISLLDLQRVMGRAMKRACIPAWYSMGFNPHIYMSFATPLSLGHYSKCEAMDFKTEADITDWSSFQEKLSACLPKGLDILSIEDALVSPEKIASAEYKISFDSENAKKFESACKSYNLLEKAEVEKQTKRGKKLIDLKDYIKDILCTGNSAVLKIPAGSTLNINPELILEFLETLGGPEKQYASIMRLRLITDDGSSF